MTNQAQLPPAARAMGLSREPADVLLEALGDPSALVRWAAAEALARRRDGQVGAKLLALAREGDPSARAAALDALSRRADAPAGLADLLAQGLGDEQAAELRQAAVQALARRPDPALAGRLTALAQGAEADVALRNAALEALGALPAATPEVAEALLAALADPCAPLRASAARAMNRLRWPEGRDALALALRDPEPQVRGEAACALALVGDRSSQPALQDLLADRQALFGREVRQLARQALRRIALRETVREVKGWLAAQAASLRRRLAQLATRPTPPAEPLPGPEQPSEIEPGAEPQPAEQGPDERAE